MGNVVFVQAQGEDAYIFMHHYNHFFGFATLEMKRSSGWYNYSRHLWWLPNSINQSFNHYNQFEGPLLIMPDFPFYRVHVCLKSTKRSYTTIFTKVNSSYYLAWALYLTLNG